MTTADRRSMAESSQNRGHGPSHQQNQENGLRPSSAPGSRNGFVRPSQSSSRADSINSTQSSPKARPVKPHLLRSKSEHVLRNDDKAAEDSEDEVYNWGARHGFEGHYQSEDVITQLASVRIGPTPPSPAMASSNPVLLFADMVHVLYRQTS